MKKIYLFFIIFFAVIQNRAAETEPFPIEKLPKDIQNYIFKHYIMPYLLENLLEKTLNRFECTQSKNPYSSRKNNTIIKTKEYTIQKKREKTLASSGEYFHDQLFVTPHNSKDEISIALNSYLCDWDIKSFELSPDGKSLCALYERSGQDYRHYKFSLANFTQDSHDEKDLLIPEPFPYSSTPLSSLLINQKKLLRSKKLIDAFAYHNNKKLVAFADSEGIYLGEFDSKSNSSGKNISNCETLKKLPGQSKDNLPFVEKLAFTAHGSGLCIRYSPEGQEIVGHQQELIIINDNKKLPESLEDYFKHIGVCKNLKHNQ